MTTRSLRRATERAAAKQAYQTWKTAQTEGTTIGHPISAAMAAVAAESCVALEDWTSCPKPVSNARLAANRTNAQLSTGPTSETGKRISSLNAVKTGLTGQTVLLPSDDVAAYEAIVAAFAGQYRPATVQESQLVQNLADTRWRLNRIPTLEFALFARGRQEFAEKFAAHQPELASALVDAEILVAYAKQLKNLHTQEGRLRRQYQQDLAELKALQAERSQAEAEIGANAAASTAPAESVAAAAAGAGFEFAVTQCGDQTLQQEHNAPFERFDIAA